ncbi:MAG: hypothetical protein ABW006_12920 [Hyphomicrobium sp.]
MFKVILPAAAILMTGTMAYAEGPASGPSSQATPNSTTAKTVGVNKPVPSNDPHTKSAKSPTNADPGGLPPASAEPKK